MPNTPLKVAFGGFISDLHSAIANHAKIVNSSSDCIPTKNHLSKIVNAVFWASLLQEEGQNHNFSIRYESDFSPGESTFEFKKRKPCDPATLAKIAPAMGRINLELIATPSKKSGLTLPGFLLKKLYDRSKCSLRTVGPGKVNVSVGFRQIAGISIEKCGLIETAFREYWYFIDKLDPTKDLKRYLLRVTLREMIRLKRGGALVIVPPESQNEVLKNSVSENMSYEASQPTKYVKESMTQLPDDSHSEKTEQAALTLAQLTSVDGATLITPDFEIIGFGAKLKPANKQTCEKIAILDPFGKSSSKDFDKIGGTRHQSTARFVCDNPKTTVIVVSQDGRVSRFYKEGDELCQHENLEFLL